MSYQDYFQGKRITLMGLGLLGRQIKLARFLAEVGAELTVTDRKTETELEPALRELKEYNRIHYILGEHRLEDFRAADLVIRPANAPLDSPYLAEAREHGVPVKMDASLFAELAPVGVQLVGVTGTRGKSTVTHLLAAILKADGRRTFLGGNVRGMATLPLLKEVESGDTVVLELDSWQLQGFGQAELSPAVAVFTSFFPDHMNYYHGDMERYFADKAHIFRYQGPDDRLVAGEQVADKVKRADPPSRVVAAGAGAVPEDWTVPLAGQHNRYNTGLAVTAAREMGVEEAVIQAAVESFPGVPGRLEYLGEYDDITYYNDNNSTTPEATIAAVQAFPEKKNQMVLIAGGADKELEYERFGEVVPEYARSVILLSGKATEKMKQVLPSELISKEADSLEEAVAAARAQAKPGELVLFSPGASSFNMFRNEYERGDLFTALVGQTEPSENKKLS